MSTSGVRRQPPGTPRGGEFAPFTQGEPLDDGALTDGQDYTIATEDGVVIAQVGHRDISSPGSGPGESIVGRDTVYTTRYDTKEEKLAAIHSELEKHVADLADDQQWQDYLDAAARFHQYSLSNQLLIAVQTQGKATRVAGFQKWKEFDRSVMKGEKGIVILAPRTVNATVKDGAGNPVLGDDGKPLKRRTVIGFTTATVFDVSQTQGKELPRSRWNDNLAEAPPDGYAEDLEQAIRDHGYEVEYAETGDGSAGYTSAGRRKVVIGPGSPANQARALAHELGHIACGHMENLEGYHSGHGGKRSKFETEADSVAYVLSRANGMSGEMLTNSGDYIAGWAHGDNDLVRKTGEHVQKTVKGLLTPGRFRNADKQY